MASQTRCCGHRLYSVDLCSLRTTDDSVVVGEDAVVADQHHVIGRLADPRVCYNLCVGLANYQEDKNRISDSFLTLTGLHKC